MFDKLISSEPETSTQRLNNVMNLFEIDVETKSPSLWIFGYGSLIWNVGFEYSEVRKATAIGYARRFWHGNTFHRGTISKPGRVVTLTEQAHSTVPGLIFRVSGVSQIQAALKHLHYREIENGYNFETLDVEIDVDKAETNRSINRLHVLTCIARSHNDHYIGPDTDVSIAEDIAVAEGSAGRNATYLLKLAESTRQLFPDFHDQHLYTLELLVNERLTEIAVD